MHALQALADFLATFSRPVVILDLETTGGDFYRDRITEVAFLHFDAGNITSVSQLIQPQRTIEPFIEQLTGISNAMVSDAPLFADFLPNILPLLRGSLLIAHNSRFDYTFLLHESRRARIPFAMQTLCSVQLSRRLHPEFHKHSLDAIIERQGLHVKQRHRAMSDVLNLAHYLQNALLARGAAVWQQHAHALMQPQYLPEKLPENLYQALHQVHDGFGVSLWYDRQQHIRAIHTHEMAFREIAQWIHRHPDELAETHHFDFYPTISTLHSHSIQANILRAQQFSPPETSLRHSVHVVLDSHDGCLKTRIRPLKSGFHAAPPHGLFLHPKGAKRALNQWWRQFQLCPKQLGILHDCPTEEASHNPAQRISGCVPACAAQDSERHNQNVRAALPFLPCADWGNSSRVRVRETDVLSGETHDFILDNGALLLNDGSWYLDRALLDVMKQKFKQQKHAIEAV